jgi:hypothetical protein
MEKHVPLTTDNRENDAVQRDASRGANNTESYYIKGERLDVKVDIHEFTYRLLKKGLRIREDREPLKEKENEKSEGDGANVNENVINHTAFMTQKAVFAPITLFDRSRQPHYSYRFLRRDKWKDRKVVVLEVIPKDEAITGHAVYGDIWLDEENFSILKIEAAPQSIRGYVYLKELATSMRTRLELSLESEFDATYDGIRFPTSVTAIEKYKGGPVINDLKGPTGWERRKTEFRYSDYQFFMVQMDVSATVETGEGKSSIEKR